MPKYVLISNHPPESCPSAHSKLRERGEKLGSDIPTLMQRHGIKPEVVVHLDPGHKVLWVLEAPSSEAVRDMVYDGALQQWNDFEFYMASSMDWIMDRIRTQTPVW
ncbi:MAG TPA: hypothetical protein VFF30_12290 [Nitrososphaerales archaeon]|nr:hypothetical protein [Nitrososphaerales archaeon]